MNKNAHRINGNIEKISSMKLITLHKNRSQDINVSTRIEDFINKTNVDILLIN